MPSGKLLVIHGATGKWIQVLDRTTGECMAKASEDSGGVTPHASAFKHRWRVAVTDGASSNARAEQHLIRGRGSPWKLLHLLCEAHIAATCHGKTLALQAPAMSNMVHLALALGSGVGATRVFRSCLRQVITSRLTVRHARTSPDAA
eukprot:7774043-Heterocapsa_arctica.AAC.1